MKNNRKTSALGVPLIYAKGFPGSLVIIQCKMLGTENPSTAPGIDPYV